MIAKIRFKELDKPMNFSVSETINLPMLTEDAKYEGTEKTFIKDGNFYGQPVFAQVFVMEDDRMVPFYEGQGFLVEDEGGVYLVPPELVEVEEKVPQGHLLQEIKEVPKEAVEKAKELIDDMKAETKKFNIEKATGFSPKQLVVIAVVGLVIYHIAKK